MYLIRAVTDCHDRLMIAAEALRDELDGTGPTPLLLRLRFELATASREYLAATQQLWSRIERDTSDVRHRIPAYSRLKAVERDLHARYAHHVATWPVAAITADFATFADTKRQFLADLCRHTRALEVVLLAPACRIPGEDANDGYMPRGGYLLVLGGTDHVASGRAHLQQLPPSVGIASGALNADYAELCPTKVTPFATLWRDPFDQRIFTFRSGSKQRKCRSVRSWRHGAFCSIDAARCGRRLCPGL